MTGNLDDLHQATLAQQRASLGFETISALRNRGVEAFNEIMRMQA
ncbi:flagellar hook-basal body complex protein FliE [Nesterenkonia pannonica]|nr:flagellar hook-basal body complex protein FliE [Nesterenkonia pannonica]